ncbi:hypothetical protein [Endozoicomonas sp.]|uniref:hypothetical protein n=1 Tax=Endozoicomonas sp. TaxID=1892382 RepID=UPI00383B0479
MTTKLTDLIRSTVVKSALLAEKDRVKTLLPARGTGGSMDAFHAANFQLEDDIARAFCDQLEWSNVCYSSFNHEIRIAVSGKQEAMTKIKILRKNFGFNHFHIFDGCIEEDKPSMILEANLNNWFEDPKGISKQMYETIKVIEDSIMHVHAFSGQVFLKFSNPIGAHWFMSQWNQDDSKQKLAIRKPMYTNEQYATELFYDVA